MRIEESANGWAIKARATTAGTFWFLADVPESPGELTTIRVYIRRSDSPRTLNLAVIDEQGRVHGASEGDVFAHELTLRDLERPPSALLIRVSTIRPQTFRLEIDVSRRTAPAPSTTPCDPLQIDRTNPECDGVFPPCDLASPDLTNRNCCFSASCNLVVGCPAIVTARISKTDLKLAIGTRDGIMTFASGFVYQRGRAVAKGRVLDVNEDWVTFRLERDAKIDESILLSRETRVHVMQPEWCSAPTPVRNVKPAPSP